jgi:hypothetical protein
MADAITRLVGAGGLRTISNDGREHMRRRHCTQKYSRALSSLNTVRLSVGYPTVHYPSSPGISTLKTSLDG